MISSDGLQQVIDEAIGESNPILCNVKITLAHKRLSMCLGSVLGADAGANFHSWAVWGSKKAGVTIRQEDLEEALTNATIVAGIVGCLVGVGSATAVMSIFFGNIPGLMLVLGAALGLVCGAMTGQFLARWSRKKAAKLILEGNRLVLDDIGRQTTKFCAIFESNTPSQSEVEVFLAQMNPDTAENGGQALLKRAFRHYARAATTSNKRERIEATYFANCLAILNEHVKLQRYIEGAMPFIVQRCVTQRMLCFEIGPLNLSVSKDVPSLVDRSFPPELENLQDGELTDFLYGPLGYAKKRDSLEGSAARNWTNLGERMGYIVALFRCFHLDPSVHEEPYSDMEMARILRLADLAPSSSSWLVERKSEKAS